MKTLSNTRPQKRRPAGVPRARSHAGVAQLVEHSAFTREVVGSMPAARTADLLVVRLAHPCGEQQASECGHSSVVERRVYAPRVVGSNPSARTNPHRRHRRTTAVVRLSRCSSMEEQAIPNRLVVGSSPIAGTSQIQTLQARPRRSSMAEHPTYNREVVSSTLIAETTTRTAGTTRTGCARDSASSFAGVAQSVERLPCKQEVVGSIPSTSSPRITGAVASTTAMDACARSSAAEHSVDNRGVASSTLAARTDSLRDRWQAPAPSDRTRRVPVHSENWCCPRTAPRELQILAGRGQHPDAVPLRLLLSASGWRPDAADM